MSVIKLLTQGFLLPGTLVVNWIGISVEEDGGILRSFINSSFGAQLPYGLRLNSTSEQVRTNYRLAFRI